MLHPSERSLTVDAYTSSPYDVLEGKPPFCPVWLPACCYVEVETHPLEEHSLWYNDGGVAGLQHAEDLSFSMNYAKNNSSVLRQHVHPHTQDRNVYHPETTCSTSSLGWT